MTQTTVHYTTINATGATCGHVHANVADAVRCQSSAQEAEIEARGYVGGHTPEARRVRAVEADGTVRRLTSAELASYGEEAEV